MPLILSCPKQSSYPHVKYPEVPVCRTTRTQKTQCSKMSKHWGKGVLERICDGFCLPLLYFGLLAENLHISCSAHKYDCATSWQLFSCRAGALTHLLTSWAFSWERNIAVKSQGCICEMRLWSPVLRQLIAVFKYMTLSTSYFTQNRTSAVICPNESSDDLLTFPTLLPLPETFGTFFNPFSPHSLPYF